jgi:hypothetical protein
VVLALLYFVVRTLAVASLVWYATLVGAAVFGGTYVWRALRNPTDLPGLIWAKTWCGYSTALFFAISLMARYVWLRAVQGVDTLCSTAD